VHRDELDAARPAGGGWTPPARFEGSRLEETRDLDIAAIAKLVRADIREAIRVGFLPGSSRDYSVRIDRYSMGQSLDVTVRNHPELWHLAWSDTYGEELRQHSPEGRRVVELLEGIVRAYNWDGSDSMVDYFDVRFYSTVTLAGQ
jgi:hypothetical protein